MRIVTLGGTMRLYTLLQIVPSTTRLEQLVHQGLQNSGWDVLNVSIVRNSYLNNTLQVSIEVAALGDDSSQRIDDGVSNFLSQFILDGDLIFRDVSLRVTKDTRAYSTVREGAGYVKPQSQPVQNQPINAGVLATVTIRASDDENSGDTSNNYIDYSREEKKPDAAISASTMIIGIIVLVLLARRY